MAVEVPTTPPMPVFMSVTQTSYRAVCHDILHFSPFGVQVFIFETESAALAGGLSQVLAGKAGKRKRPEISLRAFSVNPIFRTPARARSEKAQGGIRLGRFR